MSQHWQKFQFFATIRMSEFFETNLCENAHQGHPKRFDMVSANGKIVGDAKYLSLVRRKKFPPAKMMEIAGHVWLLERIRAQTKFLVFGNQKKVAQLWLNKYGAFNKKVDFYFLHRNGRLVKLKPSVR